MWCAICTSERGPFTMQPLGPGDAMIVVCSDCDAPIIEQTGPDRSYEPSGGLPSVTESTNGIRKAMGADYDRLTRLEEGVSKAPISSGNHSDEDFAMLQFEQESLRRRRTGASKK